MGKWECDLEGTLCEMSKEPQGKPPHHQERHTHIINSMKAPEAISSNFVAIPLHLNAAEMLRSLMQQVELLDQDGTDAGLPCKQACSGHSRSLGVLLNLVLAFSDGGPICMICYVYCASNITSGTSKFMKCWCSIILTM